MKAKNVSTRPLEVDGGRSLPVGSTGDVNSRDPLIAKHLEAGRLVRPPTKKKPAPAPATPAAPERAVTDVGDAGDDDDKEQHDA